MSKDVAKAPISIVDDDDDVRESTALLLRMEGYRVETFPSGPAFLQSAKTAHKGCVISDVRMPEMNGVELIEQMRKRAISSPVIVLTAYADVPLAVQAMKLGACDLLMKPFDLEALLSALEAALRSGSEDGLQSVRDRLATLTPREAEVVSCLLAGKTNKEIALTLGISVRTAEAHRANIMAKTGAQNLVGLINMVVASDPTQLHGLIVNDTEAYIRAHKVGSAFAACRGVDLHLKRQASLGDTPSCWRSSS